MLRRLCLGLTVTILMLAALAQGAAADPSNNNSLTFPATCDDGQTVQLVAIGSGAWPAVPVVGSTAMFIVQAVDLTFQFTPTGGQTTTGTNSSSKPNPHGDLVTCSFDVTQPLSEGTLHLFGTATGFLTPAS
jgi:hypothetical protein